MRKYSQRFGGTVLSELNVTPLIDLAFTLMIIFMITAPLIEQSLELELPHSKNRSTIANPDAVARVEMDAAGRITLDGEAIDLPALERQLIETVRNQPETVVALRADASLPYRDIVQVLDAIKSSGARLGLATRPADNP